MEEDAEYTDETDIQRQIRENMMKSLKQRLQEKSKLVRKEQRMLYQQLKKSDTHQGAEFLKLDREKLEEMTVRKDFGSMIYELSIGSRRVGDGFTRRGIRCNHRREGRADYFACELNEAAGNLI